MADERPKIRIYVADQHIEPCMHDELAAASRLHATQQEVGKDLFVVYRRDKAVSDLINPLATSNFCLGAIAAAVKAQRAVPTTLTAEEREIIAALLGSAMNIAGPSKQQILKSAFDKLANQEQ